jgi:hypothetical protein
MNFQPIIAKLTERFSILFCPIVLSFQLPWGEGKRKRKEVECLVAPRGGQGGHRKPDAPGPY